MSGERTGRGFYFVGERLWLDFINTEIFDGGRGEDLLAGFGDLTSWCAAAQVISASQAHEMIGRWDGSPKAESTFAQATLFRAVLRRMAERIAARRLGIEPLTLRRINGVLRARAGDLLLRRHKRGYETQFRHRFSEPAQLLVPIAESAADLLSTGHLTLVRKCHNPACVLFFYDTTKNHARRWCSMTGCGNRAKVAAHYRRSRRAEAP